MSEDTARPPEWPETFGPPGATPHRPPPITTEVHAVSEGEELTVANGKERAPAWLALLFLGIITSGAIAAITATIIVPLIFNVEEIGTRNDAALGTLGDVALLGIGALAAMLGGKR